MVQQKWNAEWVQSGFDRFSRVSPMRLGAVALVWTLVSLGASRAAADFITVSSTSLMGNMALILAGLIGILIAAYLQALVLYRLRVPNPGVVMTVLVLLNAIVVHSVTDGFFGWYQEEGFFHVRLRSADPTERVAALQTLSDPLHPHLGQRPSLRALVVEHITDPDVRVAAQAMANVAELGIEGGIPFLLDSLGSEESERVGAAAIALGRVTRDPESREALEALAVTERHPARKSAVIGLALMAEPASVPALVRVLDAPDEIAIFALWALRRLEASSVRDLLHERLARQNLSSQRRCALLDTLKLVAVEEDAEWARNRYRKLPRDCEGEDCSATNAATPLSSLVCERVVWFDAFERPQVVVYGDTPRVKLLKIVANAAGKKHLSWFERIVQDPRESWRTREVANEVLRSHRGKTF